MYTRYCMELIFVGADIQTRKQFGVYIHISVTLTALAAGYRLKEEVNGLLTRIPYIRLTVANGGYGIELFGIVFAVDHIQAAAVVPIHE